MWKQASGAGEKKDPTRKSAEIQTILNVKRYPYMYSRIRKYAAISELKIERLLLNLAMRLPDGMFPVVNAGSYMNFPPLLLLPTRIPSLPCLSPLNVIIAILHCCFLLLLSSLPSAIDCATKEIHFIGTTLNQLRSIHLQMKLTN